MLLFLTHFFSEFVSRILHFGALEVIMPGEMWAWPTCLSSRGSDKRAFEKEKAIFSGMSFVGK